MPFPQAGGDRSTDPFRAAGNKRTKYLKLVSVARHQPMSSEEILSPSGRKM